MQKSHFDGAAVTWDSEPRRIALMKAVGETIVRLARPTSDMDVLDYGCGTGLVGLFLLPYVRAVTGADNSPGMLAVLRQKLAAGGIRNMHVVQLDLEQDTLPGERYDLVVSSMTLHHVANTRRVLQAFHDLLRPGGTLCIADLDTEPGVFHTAEAAASVHHHGFDRNDLKSRLRRIGFDETRDVTAHIVRKPTHDGRERGFPVFVITAQRPHSKSSS